MVDNPTREGMTPTLPMLRILSKKQLTRYGFLDAAPITVLTIRDEDSEVFILVKKQKESQC